MCESEPVSSYGTYSHLVLLPGTDVPGYHMMPLPGLDRGKCGFSRFGKILSSPLEGRFWGQVSDSVGEINTANMSHLPYAA